MLFKEKLLLSNIDSVRGLDAQEVRKRVLTGLTFADGVVVSPNVLIDNPAMLGVLAQKNVVRYLNEEGAGKFVLRGFGIHHDATLMDYFSRLPPNFILSSLPGQPTKGSLTPQQEGEFLRHLAHMQRALGAIQIGHQSLKLQPDSLSREIERRLNDMAALELFGFPDQLMKFRDGLATCVSRSDWYAFARASVGEGAFDQVRVELIDPAYNSLFVMPNEGFLQDNIRFMSGVPEIILDTGVTFRALRREFGLLTWPLKAFELISSGGISDLAKWATDEAMGYLEGKAQDKGIEFMDRKNWFGMYPRLRNFLGLELK